ncbi:response regulator [Viridibacterium curvum]|uniref:Response regulatory domain-containing protein n=1 Tax=Viridibacterium curvum TaxID=1101404 RepID=A0ABP9R3W0_9RHOO
METYEEFLARRQQGSILVVDDVSSTRAMHRLMLANRFEVRTAESGEEAIALCREQMPDLVLLDVGMPGLNGYDTCRALRESTDIPIIFATGHDSPEEHMQAYEAGGTDICVKPLSAEILLHKVSTAILQHHERRRLLTERESLQDLAQRLPPINSQRGILLEFLEQALACTTPASLAAHFIDATRHLGIHCCVRLRSDGKDITLSQDGEASPLERSVLAQLSELGPETRFKSRLCINYPHISAVISNMPDAQSAEAHRIHAQVTQRLECIQALSARIPSCMPERPLDLPANAANMLESLRLRHRSLITRIGLATTALRDNLEASFDRLGTDKHQEEVLSAALHAPLEDIHEVLRQDAAADSLFEQLLSLMTSPARCTSGAGSGLDSSPRELPHGAA